MPRGAPGEIDRLRREVERAMRENHDAEDILPLLSRLARAAAPESDAWIYAHRHLAELGVEHDPWRAALFARRVIARRPDDDGAWAVLGLAQSLLGNFRCAARAYERALVLAPENPWYAHNLGHLYDVALERPADALPLLERATAAQPQEADIAASYAHALARCGKVALARRVLRRAIRRGGTADQMALARWLDAGAPPRWTSKGASPEPPAAPVGASVTTGSPVGASVTTGSPVGASVTTGSPVGAPVTTGSPVGAPVTTGSPVGAPSPGPTSPVSCDGLRPPPAATKGDESAGHDGVPCRGPESPRPKRPRRRRTTAAE